MKRLYRNIGSAQAALEQRPEVFDSVGMNVLSHVTLKMVDDFVSKAIFQIGIASELVGVNFRAGFNHLAHDLFGEILSAVRDDGGIYFPAALQHSHDNGLAVSAAVHSALAAQTLPFVAVHESRFAADESLIHFNRRPVAAELS